MIKTNILARILRDHHTLRGGHPDLACGDAGCATQIAKEYNLAERRQPRKKVLAQPHDSDDVPWTEKSEAQQVAEDAA